MSQTRIKNPVDEEEDIDALLHIFLSLALLIFKRTRSISRDFNLVLSTNHKFLHVTNMNFCVIFQHPDLGYRSNTLLRILSDN